MNPRWFLKSILNLLFCRPIVYAKRAQRIIFIRSDWCNHVNGSGINLTVPNSTYQIFSPIGRHECS